MSGATFTPPEASADPEIDFTAALDTQYALAPTDQPTLTVRDRDAVLRDVRWLCRFDWLGETGAIDYLSGLERSMKLSRWRRTRDGLAIDLRLSSAPWRPAAINGRSNRLWSYTADLKTAGDGLLTVGAKYALACTTIYAPSVRVRLLGRRSPAPLTAWAALPGWPRVPASRYESSSPESLGVLAPLPAYYRAPELIQSTTLRFKLPKKQVLRLLPDRERYSGRLELNVALTPRHPMFPPIQDPIRWTLGLGAKGKF